MEEQNGMQYWAALSYAAIDKARIAREEKRSLIASVYALIGLVDDAEFLQPSSILYRYALCFKLPLAKVGDMAAGMQPGDVTEGGAVLVEENKERFFKFDVGSPLWETLRGNLDEEGKTLPRVLTAYRTAQAVTALGGTALMAAWYTFLPYVFPHVPFERALYETLLDRLAMPAVFEEVLESRYAGLIFDDVREAQLSGIEPAVIEWYRPYIDYKLAPDETGRPRIVARLKKQLALRRFDAVANSSRSLIALFPHDAELLLLHLAALTQSVEGKDRRERAAVLSDTLELIDTAGGAFPEQAVYLGYYRGLTLLGLGRADEAREQFCACLDLDKAFEPALFMLRGMDSLASKE